MGAQTNRPGVLAAGAGLALWREAPDACLVNADLSLLRSFLIRRGQHPRQERQQFPQRPEAQHLSGGYVLDVALELPRSGVRTRMELQDKGPGVLPAIHHERRIEMAGGEVIIRR